MQNLFKIDYLTIASPLLHYTIYIDFVHRDIINSAYCHFIIEIGLNIDYNRLIDTDAMSECKNRCNLTDVREMKGYIGCK